MLAVKVTRKTPEDTTDPHDSHSLLRKALNADPTTGPWPRPYGGTNRILPEYSRLPAGKPQPPPSPAPEVAPRDAAASSTSTHDTSARYPPPATLPATTDAPNTTSSTERNQREEGYKPASAPASPATVT